MPSELTRGHNSHPSKASNRANPPERGAQTLSRTSVSSSRLREDRNFEYIASVSRSSGLDKDGDALKDYKVQEEYRAFVQHKLDDYWQKYPRHAVGQAADAVAKQRVEVEGNLLILFRKLREGISSSQRTDQFSLEVYEISLYLSIVFSTPAQTTSILSHLLPDLYLSVTTSTSSLSSRQTTTLLALLHKLITPYPSHNAFFDLFRVLSSSSSFLLPEKMNLWICDIARCLRRHEYLQLDDLTQPATVVRLLAELESPALSLSSSREGRAPAPNLPREAFQSLLLNLCWTVRMMAWRILRSAYPQFALPVGNTREWVARVLLLNEKHEDNDKVNKRRQFQDTEDPGIDLWFSEREKVGEVGMKEGLEGRWVVKIKR
ncbi:hypothetical protein EW146_g787 [Bondarzewia mesenterica]|uniref:Uncharacterized protein n=1 Tax=Bondarzewia mesenterica TaxID=1095465 RepID=A0A4S4M5Q3_9AGAM|nr:hypothetical protein EW146_g787 [Bondarzewia mesenterica]